MNLIVICYGLNGLQHGLVEEDLLVFNGPFFYSVKVVILYVV